MSERQFCACYGSPEATEDGHRNASTPGYSCSSPATGKTHKLPPRLSFPAPFFQRVTSLHVSKAVLTVLCRQLPENAAQIFKSVMGIQLTSVNSHLVVE